ncbi:DUF2827 family protein [uncultured Haemophilus sp.]|uniref:DUF2827 family protein n=1 Tax=uncultured Haemophilus sp. TaxID=237779 RepID=UPI0025895AE2|nr:DUF2827 family protein [uncultured Haemophilus sp.]
MKKFKVGITFNLEGSNQDIWANGLNQNVINLYLLFQQSEIVEEVMLVCWGPENKTEPSKGFMLDDLNLNFRLANDVIDELDVLIDGSLTVEPWQIERMHKHGGKVVCYKMGNDYIMDVQNVLFNRPTGKVFNGAVFDMIWTLPHHENTCRSYFEVMNRCPVYVVPWIWSPIFCNKVANSLKEKFNIDFGYKLNYQPRKRIASFEANLDVVKSCFTPILISETAYRQDPNALEHVYVCNAWDKKDHPTMFNFIGWTDLVRNGILSVEGRYQMPDFLSRYVDVVVSHQWENGLNYAYNDALYGGYPFIHNSKFLPKGVGYYYDQFDAKEGAKVLLDVIYHHDKHHEDYKNRAKEYLNTLLPTDLINIKKYERELLRLFEED